MGCDGGTIPQRKEVVKNKNKEGRERKREIDAAEKWKTCALADVYLRRPIVASPYGYLMNKEYILEYLLEVREDRLSSCHKRRDHPDLLLPINTMKDIKELNLKDNPNKSNEASTSDDSSLVGWFICPITGLETNGKHKFMFSWLCGCVVSERAIKEVPNNNCCLVCQKPYQKEFQLVLINPSDKEDLERNQAALLVRSMASTELRKKCDSDNGSRRAKSSSKRSMKKSKILDHGPSTSGESR